MRKAHRLTNLMIQLNDQDQINEAAMTQVITQDSLRSMQKHRSTCLRNSFSHDYPFIQTDCWREHLTHRTMSQNFMILPSNKL